jgi:hypothetical protein
MNKTAIWIASVLVVIIVVSVAAYFITVSRPKVGKYSIFEDKIYGKSVVLDTETGRSWSYDGSGWVELPRFDAETMQRSAELEQKALIEQQLNELKVKQEAELNSVQYKYEQAEKELKNKASVNTPDNRIVKISRPASGKKHIRSASYTRKKKVVQEEDDAGDNEAPGWLPNN